MKGRAFIFAFALAGLSVPAAWAASKSVTVFSYRQWDVQRVSWPDGTMSCDAEIVYDNGDSVAIWADRKNPYRIQFYSADWSFGAKDSYDTVDVQVDNNNSYSVTNADFYKSSIFFDLPDNATGNKFLSQLAAGNRLYLYDSTGKQQTDYSLSGSQASINALTSCVNGLP